MGQYYDRFLSLGAFFSFFFFAPNDSPRAIPIIMTSKVSLHKLFSELLLGSVSIPTFNAYRVCRHMIIRLNAEQHPS